jgi:hypothetical protein
MSEPRPPKTYYSGDEIRMRMTFTHDGHISAVEVLYTHHDDRTFALTLSGNPEPVEGSPAAGDGKRSTVDLTGVVDESLIVGTYSARRVPVYTFACSAELVTPADLGDWPTLYITYGSGNIREATIELEPQNGGDE